VIVALIGLGGSAMGSFIGVLVNTKLSNYRLEQLEKKQDKHNQLIERMYNVEGEIEVLQEKQDVANHRINDLESGHEKLNDKITNLTRRNGI
jgi:peptidoglycan hydrolase CwlO-like protein